MRLSICIPTHHGRCATLRDALDSILSQITPALQGQVEICISDNASEDGTQALVEQYGLRHPGLLRYRRSQENLGFTHNLMYAIASASGDYCWMFSSDDGLAPGSLARVLELLDQNPNLTGMTVMTEPHDATLSRILPHGYPPSLLPDDPDVRHTYTSPAEIFRQCGSVMGFTSSQIFSRPLWQEVMDEIGEAGFTRFTYFPYLYLFGRMVKKRPLWIWLPEKLVHSRGDNDYLSSYLDKNMMLYHRLTMEELAQVWGELFGAQSATYQSLMHDNYLNFWNAPALLRYKAVNRCTVAEELRALLWFPRRLYFLPGFWLLSLPVLLTPFPVARLGAFFVRRSRLGMSLRLLKRRLFPLYTLRK